MKKKLHLILGILGLAIVGYGLTNIWSGFHLKLADKFMGSTGLEIWPGQAALAFAVIALILLFVRPKAAAIPALLIVACALFAFLFPKTEKHEAQMGLFMTVGGAVLTALATLMVPKRHPRK